MKPKNNFVDTLKHGKCGGREQSHPNSSIQPSHCLKNNAGDATHLCPDTNIFFISEDGCNCCEDCYNVCYQSYLARSKDTMKDIYNQWKKRLDKLQNRND